MTAVGIQFSATGRGTREHHKCRRNPNPAVTAIPEILNRLRVEFLEMSCLRLTSAQVERLCGVERTICLTVLGLLLDEGFLCVTAEGRIKRLTSGHHPLLAKANLTIDTRNQTHAEATRPC